MHMQRFFVGGGFGVKWLLDIVLRRKLGMQIMHDIA
jgi:hypothetical protein